VVILRSLETWQRTAALATSTTPENVFRARRVEAARTPSHDRHRRHAIDTVATRSNARRHTIDIGGARRGTIRNLRIARRWHIG